MEQCDLQLNNQKINNDLIIHVNVNINVDVNGMYISYAFNCMFNHLCKFKLNMKLLSLILMSMYLLIYSNNFIYAQENIDISTAAEVYTDITVEVPYKSNKNQIFQSLDNSRNYFNRALILAKNGNHITAVTLLNAAINLDPQYVDAYIARANILEKQGNLTAALVDYNAALNFHSSDQIFYNRGMLKLALKKFTEAILDFNNAIELNPLFAKAYYERGIALLSLNVIIEAKHDFMQAFKLNPKLLSALEKTGELNLIQQNYAVALENYNELINLKNKDPDLYFKRGQIYELLGNYPKALNDYQFGIDIYNSLMEHQQNKDHANLDLQINANPNDDYGNDETLDNQEIISNFVSYTVN